MALNDRPPRNRVPGGPLAGHTPAPECGRNPVAPSEGLSVKRTLVAYDGSAAAQRALVHAAELARPGDSVTVVNVMPEPAVGARIEPPIGGRSRQWHLLDEAQRFMAEREIEAHTLAPVGNVASEILAAAEQLEADVIVVARDRARGLPRAHGSISGHIVRAASCDVLVVHAADAEPGSTCVVKPCLGDG